MGNEHGKLQRVPTPAGIQCMDETLQKKFSKGIQYNMKIIIRGDRNTGKTTLFHRMEGKPFNEAYIPTNEIEVTSILWSYRVTNDTVKVEIWDIVDKGRSQRKLSGKGGSLKMFNSPVEEEDECEVGCGKLTLDANFLNVYNGAHGVVFTFDIVKQWTWQYIERELPRVPLHVPVIILANFHDLNEHRLISREDCQAVIDSLQRPDGAAEICYAECSLKNGFGLMHLHKFLSIPFLQLQQETLLQQLQVNREQMMAAMEELDTAVNTEDQNYDKFMAKLDRIAEEKKRRASMSRQQRPDSLGSDDLPGQRDIGEAATTAIPHHLSKATPPAKQDPALSEGVGISQSQQPSSSNLQRSGSLVSKFSSKFSGMLGRGKEMEKNLDEAAVSTPPRPRPAPKENIEEFVPDGEVDEFLGEEDEEDEDFEDDSDEDPIVVNHLIAADEDLSSPDETKVTTVTPRTTLLTMQKQPVQVSLSESDEEPPSILYPVKAPLSPASLPKSKPSPKPLKSALDIELTESEEEGRGSAPLVMLDEDIDGRRTIMPNNGKKKGMADAFEPPVPETRRKQTGLMLQFDTCVKPQQVVAASWEVSKESQDSTSQTRREKKKKSKKSKHTKNEESSVLHREVKETGNGKAVVSAADPFSAISSLDAWLNSSSNDVGEFCIPSPVVGLGGMEVGTEERVEEGEVKTKKAKKHKHKRHGEEKEGRQDEIGEERSHRKHHHSQHKSSRHRRLNQGD